MKVLAYHTYVITYDSQIMEMLAYLTYVITHDSSGLVPGERHTSSVCIPAWSKSKQANKIA